MVWWKREAEHQRGAFEKTAIGRKMLLAKADRSAAMIRASMLLVLASLSLVPAGAFAAPACDVNPNDSAQFQRVDIFITKNGTIVWNGTPVTRDQFRAYIQDEVAVSWGRGPVVYNYMGEENRSPLVVAKAKSVMAEAQSLGAAFPGCESVGKP
jgi:hypothetical protein